MLLKTIALVFFVVFWLVVVARLLMRSKQLDEACSRIPLDDDVTTPRSLSNAASSLPRTQPQTQTRTS